jgi:hypothetical protein
MELTRLGFAKSGEYTDGLHRSEAAHQADHRTENANFGAAIAVISIMSITDKTAVAGLVRFPPAKCSDLAVKLANRGRHQRHLRYDAQIIDDQPRRKIIAPVNHDINAVKQAAIRLMRNPLAQCCERHIRVELAHHALNHIDLSRTDIRISIKYLPLKIRTADDIIINHAQPPYASGGKILDRRAANPARANDKDMRIKKSNLPCPANLPQDNMASVTVKLFVA